MRRSLAVLLSALVASCTELASGEEVLRDARVLEPAMDAGSTEPPAPEVDAAGDAASSDAEVASCPSAGQRARRVLSQLTISQDERWDCQSDIEIDGYVHVRQGTLTIDPGVRIYAREQAFVLVGTEGRLRARGTAQEPIVMRPARAAAQPGSYRGIVMLGLADTTLPNSSTVALPVSLSATFGGSDDAHDCGTLTHVRIEFAGGSRADDEDMPAAALTLAGCGRETRVDSVQVHGASDGIGLIGGTVPLKRVLVSAAQADGIEWTAGYRGLIQFALVQSFSGSGAALKGSTSQVNPEATPRSHPLIFNATLVGANTRGLPSSPADPNGFETGVLVQAGTGLTLANSLLYGFWGSWFDIVGSESAALFGTDSSLRSTLFADGFPASAPRLPGDGVEARDTEDDDGNLSEEQLIRQASLQNRFPQTLLSLEKPFARPPERPLFSTSALVDSGSLVDTAPSGWQGVWERAFYAGALPKLQAGAAPERDFTCPEPPSCWTSFPKE